MKNLSTYENFVSEAQELTPAQQNIMKERDLNQKINDLREKFKAADEKGDVLAMKKINLMMRAARLQKELNDISYEIKELSEIEKRKKKN